VKYGHFDNAAREYVIDRVDVPVSWTNYIGVNRACAVLSQNAGGYSFHRHPEYGRITRFRPNGVPMDWPGHWVYLRDDADGDYWSVSWQPVGKPLDEATYSAAHGLSYSRYRAEYRGIEAEQTIFITRDDDVEIWDVRLRNSGEAPRTLSLFSYVEFSFHTIEIDNQNFQMSLYAAGADYADGVIDYDFYYEPWAHHFHTASFEPDSFDTTREAWIGDYRTERNPLAVETGRCSGSQQTTGNHCGALHSAFTLEPGQEHRVILMMGYGDRETGRAVRAKYSDLAAVDAAFADLRAFWDEKLAAFQVDSPHEGLDTMANVWTLYQAEVCVMWSRFASFIETGGRTGLGYRDTAQDVMAVAHTNPVKVRQRIRELLNGQMGEGFGLHLFDPQWFATDYSDPALPVRGETHIPESAMHGPWWACSDDHLWLVPSILEYVRETGDVGFLDEVIPFADGGEASVWEHMRRGLEYSAKYVGASGICMTMRADWNDCLNLGDGESAMVSFLHHWALAEFVEAARRLGRTEDAEHYEQIRRGVQEACERELWDGSWYARGVTRTGRRIGVSADPEAKVFMESNTWAIVSGAAAPDRAASALDAIDEYLYSPWGLHLLAPSYTTRDDEVGFVTRVYPGVKENGAIFSHPNPWAVVAAAQLGQGERAMRFYDALLPYNQNDRIEVRQAEPYSYCQFVYGAEHPLHGRARHPWLTGSAGWNYTAVTKWILGVRVGYDELVVDPCIPADWDGFHVTRRWRGSQFDITVANPDHVSHGVVALELDGAPVDRIGVQPAGTTHTVHVVMG
jgi:N,N'-diacetylchitobiose phosphorylase